MFNLIKMDLCRLFRSVSTYVMITLAAVFAVFAIFVTNYSLSQLKDEPTSVPENTEINPNDFSLGFFSDTNPDLIKGDIDFTEMLGAQIKTKVLLLLVSVFVTLFVTSERKNGFIKNIAGQFRNRGVMVMAKTVSVAIQTFILLAVFAVFAFFSCIVIWGDRIVLNSIWELMKMMGIQYSLHFAFACLIAFLCFLTNSSALSMTIGILICSGFSSPVYYLINQAIGKSFRIERYMLEANISYIGAGAASDTAVRAVVAATSFILVTMILSALTVQKRDIK